MAEYEHGSGVILSNSKLWEVYLYLFFPEGIGDCMNRTGEYAYKKRSYKALYAVTRWLKERKRWPDCFNNSRIAKNILIWRWLQLLYKLKIRKTVLYRPQKRMTRDCYVPYYCACLELGHGWKIKEVKPPRYLFRPTWWIWRRYLITGKGLWLYYFMTLNYPKKDYVIKLRKYMNEAVNIKKEQR